MKILKFVTGTTTAHLRIIISSYLCYFESEKVNFMNLILCVSQRQIPFIITDTVTSYNSNL